MFIRLQLCPINITEKQQIKIKIKIDSRLFMLNCIYFIKRFIKYIRERPFNLKGGVMVFFLTNILIPNVAEKNILILVEETNNNLIRVFVI